MVTGLGIKGGSSRDPCAQRPAQRPGLAGSRGSACQSPCRRPGPSVLQQEVGGHVKVVIGSSQGFQRVAPGKSHLHEPGDLKTETKPEV